MAKAKVHKQPTRRDEIRAARDEEALILRWRTRKGLRILEFIRADPAAGTLQVAQLFLWFSPWGKPSDLISESSREALDCLDYLVEVIRLKELPYDEYLKTDHWHGVAESAKRRFDGRCALNDQHPADDAHHRTYVRRGRELRDDVVPLCRQCHSKFHGHE